MSRPGPASPQVPPIVLLSRTPDTEVASALARLGAVQVVRSLNRPGRSSGPEVGSRYERRVRKVAGLVARAAVPVVVCDDDASVQFGWAVAEDVAGLFVLPGQELAARVLTRAVGLADGSPDAASVGAALHEAEVRLPEVPGYLHDRADRPPLVVSLVNNAITGDSRVQKVARSLADLGYDSVLLGVAPRRSRHGDHMVLGRALALRLRASFEQSSAQLEHPPGGILARLAGRPSTDEAVGRVRGGLDSLRTRIHLRNRESFTDPDTRSRSHAALAERVRDGREAPGRAYPRITELSDAFVPVIEQLRPDAIHIHDPSLIPAALSGKQVLADRGIDVRLVYDAHEWTLGIRRHHALQVAALARLESDHLRGMDAIITVSDAIADRMTDHFELARPPTVVTNGPVALPFDEAAPSLRDHVGVGPDVPLLVYAGGVAVTRGLDVAVRALIDLPGVHLALICKHNRSASRLLRTAEKHGVAERVHRLDYVPADEVPQYLRTADMGLIPFLGHLNSDLGIPTKFREYLLAGLPIVGTDVGLTGAEIRRTGVGEVAAADDPAALAAAIRKVLAAPSAYRLRITPELRAANAWQSQEAALAAVYAGAVGPAPELSPATDLVIGRVNSAGQGNAWAGALRRAGVRARAIEFRDAGHPFQYPADLVVPKPAAATLERRCQVLLREVLPARAVILESARAISSPEVGSVGLPERAFRQARALVAAGRRVGLLFHGSDIRRPDLHAQTHEWSPFAAPDTQELREAYRASTRRVHELLASWTGPVMVSTPDLVGQNPAATWVPVVVDAEAFAAVGREPPGDIPVVLHFPSRSQLKGSRLIDPVLEQLDRQGIISYRRVRGMPHREVPGLLAECDVLVDQLGMGILGVASLEAMASGIPVVSDPGPEALVAYDEPVPMVVVTPETLSMEVRRLARDPELWHRLSEQGPAFVRRHHDGRRSANAMMAAMGLTPVAPQS